MSTTKNIPNPHLAVLGVDSTSPPHLVAPDKWVQQHNIRAFNGAADLVPPKSAIGMVTAANDPLLFMGGVPTGINDQSILIGLSATKMYLLNQPDLSTSIEIAGFTGVTVSGVYRRWATVLYNQYLWFLNDYNKLKYTDGTRVVTPTAADGGTDLPSGRYMEVFFDHLFIACPTFKGDFRPTQVRWCALYDMGNWTPKTSNEADHFDFEEWSSTDFPLIGCTGLGRMGDQLLVFTPTAIFHTPYVGLPKVVHFKPLITSVGNSLMYGLASYKDNFFFFDAREVDFFQLSQNGLVSIGQDIMGYFSENMSTVFETYQKTWAQVIPEKQEVHWHFQSKNASGFDKTVVYNWDSKRWFTMDNEGFHCVSGVTRRGVSCDDLNGLINSCDRYFQMQEASGNRVDIIDQFVNPLLVPTNVSTVVGPVGGFNAAHIDAGGKLQATSFPFLRFTDKSQTWQIWINPDAVLGTNQVVLSMDDTGLTEYKIEILYLANVGKFQITIADKVMTSAVIGPGGWASLVFGYEAGTGLHFIYSVGKLLKFYKTPLASVTSSLSSTLRVGNNSGLTQTFVGGVCYLGRWNRVLTLAEMSYLSSEARPYSFGRTIDGLTGTCNGLGLDSTSLYPRLYAHTNGKITRDYFAGDAYVTADPDEVIFSRLSPTLESKDYIADGERVIEINSVVIHAKYDTVSVSGIAVYLSMRSYIDDTVTYVNVGTWKPTLPQKKLTFPIQSGRIFRWKFVPIGTVPKSFRWSAFTDSIYSIGAQQ